MLQQLPPISYLKNNINVTGLSSFLDTYAQEQKLNSAYKQINMMDLNNVKPESYSAQRDKSCNVMSTFKNLIDTLDCDDKECSNDVLFTDSSAPVLHSYMQYNTIQNFTFSVLDACSNNFSLEVEKIKTIFNKRYPYIFINTYKYKMLEDFYQQLGIDQSKYRIIYKIIILTLGLVVDNVEACDEENVKDTDLKITLENLKNPPSLQFCKQLMRYHELSCIFEDTNETKLIRFNYLHYKSRIYIHFEFRSRFFVLLKHCKLRDADHNP